MTRKISMPRLRIKLRSHSNNPDNPNKNSCALAVAKYLYVDDETFYLHTWQDVQRAIRKLWSMRSVKSYVKAKPDSTVGSLRKAMLDYAEKDQMLAAYVVRVENHVLVIDRKGNTRVDTAPRKQDRRKVLDIYGVYHPNNRAKMRKIMDKATLLGLMS